MVCVQTEHVFAGFSQEGCGYGVIFLVVEALRMGRGYGQ